MTDVYDKGKYHYDSDDFPEDKDPSYGYVHIAFFVRWCLENNLLSDELIEDSEDEIEALKSGKISSTYFLRLRWMRHLFLMMSPLKRKSLYQGIMKKSTLLIMLRYLVVMKIMQFLTQLIIIIY